MYFNWYIKGVAFLFFPISFLEHKIKISKIIGNLYKSQNNITIPNFAQNRLSNSMIYLCI